MQDWKAWERQVVDGAYPLRQYLADGVFLTEFGDPEPRKAAIKIVLASPDHTASPLERWKLASALSHPHLLPIYTMGSSNLNGVEFAYLVTEYAEENLAQVIPDRPLTSGEAREMLDPTLDALGFIHQKGFVHGRLKPANIMAVDGSLKLSVAALCRTGECAPAPRDAYTPPDNEGPSPAGDVWSLGISLIEALTQRPEAIVPATLPAPFHEIARGCLETDPSGRWSVADIATWLKTGALAVPERKVDKGHAPSKKRPYKIAALVLLTALPIVLAALAIYNQPAPNVSTANPVSTRKHAVKPKPEAPVESPPPAPHSYDPPAVAAPVPPPPSQTDLPAVATPVPPVPVQPERFRTGAANREVIRRVMPDVLAKASQSIHGKVKVRVRVRVDPSGNVSAADLVEPGPSKYFAQSALTAARRWRFTPAKTGDAQDSSEWTLRFEFLRTGPQVEAVRTAP